MTRQAGDATDPEFLRQGPVAQNSTFAETVRRQFATADLAIAASGVVQSVAIPLQSGDLVTSLTFVTGATAAATPTAGFLALYSPAGALLGQSANFGSTARAANTAFTVPLATPVLASTPGLYYVAISFTAGTVPTLRGVSLGDAVLAGALGLQSRILSQSHGSAVGGTAPATIATPTTTAVVPYIVAT